VVYSLKWCTSSRRRGAVNGSPLRERTVCVLCFLCSENYLFHCTCEKCNLEADQPDTTSEEEEDDDDDDDDSDCMEFVE